MTRGAVWMVRLPITTSREQGGERPAIIVQDETYGQNSPLVLVVPLTSSLGALRFPATLQIEPSPENGLTLSSVAMMFQARALDRSRFVRRLGVVSNEDLTLIFNELDALMGR